METFIDGSSASRRFFPSGVVNAVRRMSSTGLVVRDTIRVWSERTRQRRQLQSLPDHMLNDIGVSRADIFRECGKPFWKA
jgi:uncharacterized protein YjiS (DUF1127 family)